MPKRIFVTGGAGFIGSNLTDRLLELGSEVTVYDNLSTGLAQFLDSARRSDRFKFVRGDLLDREQLTSAIRGHDFVFHLAANADVRFGTDHPTRDLEQNTIATQNVLEAMRQNGIKSIAFSSTGSVYGEAAVIPTPENCPFPVQTSLYGASKLAGEGLISAYCEGFGFTGLVFRFVSILGERYTHGHIYDFYRKLNQDPARLEILGNGRQRKSYLYIGDCIDAMLTAISQAEEGFKVFNLGTDEFVEVNDSVSIIESQLGLHPQRAYTGGCRGWVGDNPFIFLDCARIRELGWRPKFTIAESIKRTLSWLQQNQWVYAERN